MKPGNAFHKYSLRFLFSGKLNITNYFVRVQAYKYCHKHLWLQWHLLFNKPLWHPLNKCGTRSLYLHIDKHISIFSISLSLLCLHFNFILQSTSGSTKRFLPLQFVDYTCVLMCHLLNVLPISFFLMLYANTGHKRVNSKVYMLPLLMLKTRTLITYKETVHNIQRLTYTCRYRDILMRY